MTEKNPLFDKIQELIDTNDVILFMKGTPESPSCGFSAVVAQILTSLGGTYKGIDVLQDYELREAIKEFSEWPTIPQLYIKGEFIGGCDIVRDMYNNNELQELLPVSQ